jgi:hypothetical protein
MARTTVIQLIDDIDGSEADRTVDFGYMGKRYSLDLNEKNAAELEEILAPYIAAASKGGAAGSGRAGGSSRAAGRPAGASRVKSDSDVDPKAVRAWAEANGVEVSPRGRVKADVVERYRASGH